MNINTISYPGSIVLVAVSIFLLISFIVQALIFNSIEKKTFLAIDLSDAYLAFLLPLKKQDTLEQKKFSLWKWYFLPQYSRLTESCYKRVLRELERQSCYDRDYDNYGCLKNLVSILFQWEDTARILDGRNVYILEKRDGILQHIKNIIAEKMFRLFAEEAIRILKLYGVVRLDKFLSDQAKLSYKYAENNLFADIRSFRAIFIRAHMEKISHAIKNEVHKVKGSKITLSETSNKYSQLLNMEMIYIEVMKVSFQSQRESLFWERDMIIEMMCKNEHNPEKYEELVSLVHDRTLREKLTEKVQKVLV